MKLSEMCITAHRCVLHYEREAVTTVQGDLPIVRFVCDKKHLHIKGRALQS